MNGLLCIIILLPNVPSLLPTFLNELFQIFTKLAAVKYAESNHLTKDRVMHLNLGLKMFFDLLYGMYPCNFLNYIKESSKKDNNQLAPIIRPLLESVKIHPLLVLSDQETELNKTRWNQKEPHDVVSECDNLSITYLAYSADQRDSMYMDLTNDILSLSNSTPLPATQNFMKTNVLSPSYRLVSPGSTIDNTIWSPLNVISQKSPLITSAPSTAQNTPLPVPFTAFQASNFKITPNNMLVISGTSPPEAAVEATPESTPLKEIDSQSVSFQQGHKNPFAVRDILTKIHESPKPKAANSTRLAEMLSHRIESTQRLNTDFSSYEQQPVVPRNRFLSERDNKIDLSDYHYKQPETPKKLDNIASSKSCPDLNEVSVSPTNNTNNKPDSVFVYTTKSTQTSDCSLSNKLIDLIEETNRLKREQMVHTPLEISPHVSREILNDYIDKIARQQNRSDIDMVSLNLFRLTYNIMYYTIEL